MAKVSYDDRDGEYTEEHDDPLPDVIWYRVDGHSNGRWLYVDHPSAYYGGVIVGIQDVYRKYLSSEEARLMAEALLQAANEWDVLKAETEAERDRLHAAIDRCEQELGGHDWPPTDEATRASQPWALPVVFVCRACGVDARKAPSAFWERQPRRQPEPDTAP